LFSQVVIPVLGKETNAISTKVDRLFRVLYWRETRGPGATAYLTVAKLSDGILIAELYTSKSQMTTIFQKVKLSNLPWL
jgi:hypothetical protein